MWTYSISQLLLAYNEVKTVSAVTIVTSVSGRFGRRNYIHQDFSLFSHFQYFPLFGLLIMVGSSKLKDNINNEWKFLNCE